MSIDQNLENYNKGSLGEVLGIGGVIIFVATTITALGLACYKYGPKLYEYIESIIKQGIDGKYGF